MNTTMREPGEFIATTPAENECVKILNNLFFNAVRMGASDVHIEDEENEVRVRYRLNGIMQEITQFPRALSRQFNAKIRMKASIPTTETTKPTDGKISLVVDDRRIEYRVSILVTALGQSIVCRILDSENAKRNIESIYMPDLVRERLMELLRAPDGMLLLSGPTGSGKTSTLYAALNKLNTTEVKIVTIEDPVEYMLPGLQQVPIKEGVRFADVLRATLRQDPDVILVGEIRDTETATIATAAANTGHLVLSSTHANNSVETVSRLLDLGVEPYSVSSALRATLAQRLIPQLCPNCRGMRKASSVERRILERLGRDPDAEYGQVNHCDVCKHLGQKGRLPVMEMLVVDEALRRGIEQCSKDAIRDAAIKQPQYRSLADAAIDLSAAGMIELDHALGLVSKGGPGA